MPSGSSGCWSLSGYVVIQGQGGLPATVVTNGRRRVTKSNVVALLLLNLGDSQASPVA